jgi:hypothetical protein
LFLELIAGVNGIHLGELRNTRDEEPKGEKTLTHKGDPELAGQENNS